VGQDEKSSFLSGRGFGLGAEACAIIGSRPAPVATGGRRWTVSIRSRRSPRWGSSYDGSSTWTIRRFFLRALGGVRYPRRKHITITPQQARQLSEIGGQHGRGMFPDAFDPDDWADMTSMIDVPVYIAKGRGKYATCRRRSHSL